MNKPESFSGKHFKYLKFTAFSSVTQFSFVMFGNKCVHLNEDVSWKLFDAVYTGN